MTKRGCGEINHSGTTRLIGSIGGSGGSMAWQFNGGEPYQKDHQSIVEWTGWSDLFFKILIIISR